MKREIPEHVNWRIQDVRLAILPCTYDEPYCHVDCPYFTECNPDEEVSDMDKWDEYFNNQ